MAYQNADERSLWLLRRRLKDFDRLIFGEDLRVSFLTVSLSPENLGDASQWISSLMHDMKQKYKRVGSKFFYVAVLEIQPKRYQVTGVLAPHWHVAIATSFRDGLPHAQSLKDENGRRHIKKIRNGKIISWDWLYKNAKQKFGMYFICDAWSHDVFDYLGKYLAKGGYLKEFKAKVDKRVKVFSSSRFPIKYQMSWLQLEDYQKLLNDQPGFEDLYWRREGSRIVARAKNVDEIYFDNGHSFLKISYDKITVIKGEWVAVETIGADVDFSDPVN